MRLPTLSFRWKMVFPAAVASLATLAATLVAAWLLSRSEVQLRLVEQTHFPLLLLSKDIEVRIGAIQRQFQDAAANEDATALQGADLLEDDLHKVIEAAPASTLPAARREELLRSVDDYYAVGKAVTLKLVLRETGKDLAESLQEMSARYKALRDDLARSTASAQAQVADGFERSRSLQESVLRLGLLFVLAATAVGIGLALVNARSTARPLEQLTQAALRIADGDLTREIAVDSNDEIGVLAGSFQRMGERLRVVVGTLKESASELAVASAELAEHTEVQTAILQRQASGVTETSTTTRELEQTSSVAASRAASVLLVARRAGQMSESGRDAADRSLEGLQVIQGSVDGLVRQSAQLLDQARQVGEIVGTVRDLAMQSHVLSLNASIEAARAGEAGRGFGVVATEVRALAEQSGRSADRIGRIVKDILGAIQQTLRTTEEGTRGMEGSVAQIRASGESLREIGGIVGETSEAAAQIAGAVQQQSQGVAQIAAAMRDLDSGMRETMTRIEKLRESASRLTETATRISLIADGFKL